MMKHFVIPAAVLASVVSAAAPGGLFEDCNKSQVPHSKRCLMEWWHNAGCTSGYAFSKEAGWVNQEDISTIKKEMQDAYKKAAATDAAADDINKCQPVPKWQKRAQDCYVALENDCSDCFVGPMNILVNTTCTVECIDNSDSLQKKCGNLYNSIQCNRKVDELCGDCVSTGFLGIPMVDPQCFTDCYQQNNQTIRDACPLPEPLQKAKDCHDKLVDVCKDCVSGEHDIDGKCLASCWDENEATLNKTCPVQFGELAAFLSTVDESNILSSLANGLSNGGGEVTEIANLLGTDGGNTAGLGGDVQGALAQISGVLENIFGQLFGGQQPTTASDGSQPSEPVVFTVAAGDNTQSQGQGIQDLLSQLGFGPVQQQPQGSASDSTQGQPQQPGDINDILAQFGFAPPQQQAPAEKPTKPTKPTQTAAPSPSADDSDMANMMAPMGADNNDGTATDNTSSEDSGSVSTENQRAPTDQEPVNGLQMLLGGGQQ